MLSDTGNCREILGPAVLFFFRASPDKIGESSVVLHTRLFVDINFL